MNLAVTFSDRPPSRPWSTVNEYLPSVAATLPTPSSVMPTFAPASGCPPLVVTLPLKTTLCAEATLAANAMSAVSAARLGTVRRSHEPSMTDLVGEMDDDFDAEKTQKSRSASIDDSTSAPHRAQPRG